MTRLHTERSAHAHLCLLAAVLLFTFRAAQATALSGNAAHDVDKAQVLTGEGFVLDASHPRRPGDFQRLQPLLEISSRLDLGEASIEVKYPDRPQSERDRWFVRAGRIFQIDAQAHESVAAPLGELSAATIAALHPDIVMDTMRRRGESVRAIDDGPILFAWNDELWEVFLARPSGRLLGLARNVHHYLKGDITEEIRYQWAQSTRGIVPARVEVLLDSQKIAEFAFSSGSREATVHIPGGEQKRDRIPFLAADEIVFTPLADAVFAINLPSVDLRVLVVEFDDHVAVLEGAYNARNGDLIGQRISSRFDKPVRYFAFSHVHGQYVGSVRSWIHAGATILVPPSTVPLSNRQPRRGTSSAPTRSLATRSHCGSSAWKNGDACKTSETRWTCSPWSRTTPTNTSFFTCPGNAFSSPAT